jgi:hypothetical protein
MRTKSPSIIAVFMAVAKTSAALVALVLATQTRKPIFLASSTKRVSAFEDSMTVAISGGSLPILQAASRAVKNRHAHV